MFHVEKHVPLLKRQPLSSASQVRTGEIPLTQPDVDKGTGDFHHGVLLIGFDQHQRGPVLPQQVVGVLRELGGVTKFQRQVMLLAVGSEERLQDWQAFLGVGRKLYQKTP